MTLPTLDRSLYDEIIEHWEYRIRVNTEVIQMLPIEAAPDYVEYARESIVRAEQNIRELEDLRDSRSIFNL